MPLVFPGSPQTVLSYPQGVEVKPRSKPFTQWHALSFPGYLLTFQAGLQVKGLSALVWLTFDPGMLTLKQGHGTLYRL